MQSLGGGAAADVVVNGNNATDQQVNATRARLGVTVEAWRTKQRYQHIPTDSDLILSRLCRDLRYRYDK